jgi:hypothetical protein
MRQSIMFTLACILLALTLIMCETSNPAPEEKDNCTLESTNLEFGPVIIGERDIRTFTVTFRNETVFPNHGVITIDCEDFAFWDAVEEAPTDTFTYEWAG